MSASKGLNKNIKKKLDELKNEGTIEGTLIEKIDVNSDVYKILTIELNKEIMKYHRNRTSFRSSRTYDPMGSYKDYITKMIKKALENGSVIIDEDMMKAPVKVEIVVGTKPVKSGNSILKIALMLAKKIFRIKTPDIDNYIKTCFDISNKVLFEDDRQVVEVNAKKVYHKDEFTHMIIHYYRDMSEYKGTSKDLLSQGIITEEELLLAKKIKKGTEE